MYTINHNEDQNFLFLFVWIVGDNVIKRINQKAIIVPLTRFFGEKSDGHLYKLILLKHLIFFRKK